MSAPPEDHQEEVGVQVPLVHLVDNNVGDAGKVGSGIKLLEQHARSAEEEPRPPCAPRVEAHSIPHRAAQFLPALLSHA
eukprot:CAMPEP_0180616254 /NCGR_PEP_ID=MMETSP1037_2-20121125/32380_1 /TAXON_ID=632150 /ORGANISM="Azadinium spinosum, Strain 3D9" /LENGTH=78 /DNA_ID=CAMNT_0022636077 /DNA_START=414 /DNA_END=648 /DNA_ORIENTATION=-